MSYSNWCVELGQAAGAHGVRIAFGPSTYWAWERGESADTYARRQPSSRLSAPLGSELREVRL